VKNRYKNLIEDRNDQPQTGKMSQFLELIEGQFQSHQRWKGSPLGLSPEDRAQRNARLRKECET
jgi:hypothetical protein